MMPSGTSDSISFRLPESMNSFMSVVPLEAAEKRSRVT